jgi:hypothetical protein
MKDAYVEGTHLRVFYNGMPFEISFEAIVSIVSKESS